MTTTPAADENIKKLTRLVKYLIKLCTDKN